MVRWFTEKLQLSAKTRHRKIIKALTERREQLGMSDYHIAQRSGVSQPTVHRILSGNNPQASFEKVMAVAEAMGMTLQPKSIMSVGELREFQADRKASGVVNRTRATSALEGQGVSVKTIREMHERVKQRLLASSAKDLWSE